MKQSRRQFLQTTAPAVAALAAGGCATFGSKKDVTVEVSEFGNLPDGRAVKLYTMRNQNGMVAKVMDYGAILTELHVPDRHGKTANVVLGFDRLQPFLDNGTPFGATIGRVANRIANAKFTLDGKEIQVTANSGKNQIHGGRVGFHRKPWQGRVLSGARDRAAVELKHRSADGEEGFPGNCDVTLVYALTARNELLLEYSATTDKPTPINLTNHSYFNLAGAGVDVLNHELQLFASRYTVANGDLIPTGQIASVAGTGLDFRKPEKIGARIKQFYPRPGGYDHNFVIDETESGIKPAARVVEPVSGRVMECATTEPGVQLYTANWSQPQKFKGSDVTHPPHGAFCLETQHYPDSVNHPNFPSTILRPGQTFRSTTLYKFSAK
jgi:aldose 1-epimerase